MSSLAHSPVTWQDFLRLPERPETGQRYELHDGEVIVVPPPLDLCGSSFKSESSNCWRR
jgi:Uma2 family endonuclease